SVTWAVITLHLPALKKIAKKMLEDFKKISPDT
ncbi:MAG: hypothetical protein UY80_C0019G0001, partial [Parcubacteria group bacterium GW2011_GWB1_53_43]